MDKKEALELYLKLHEECGVADDCNDCVFCEPFKGDRGCILDYIDVDEVAMSVREKLKLIDEKQEESSVQSEKIKETTTLYVKSPLSAEEFEKHLKAILPQKLALEPLNLPKEDRAIKYPNEHLKQYKQDNINHPKHYCKSGLECIDAIRAAVSNLPPFEAICVANFIKYAWRYKDKNGLEDVKKAAKYLRLLQEEMKKNG